jgi:hypothetical protein
MRFTIPAIVALAGLGLTSGASAMPMSNLSQTVQGDQPVEQVRLVCDSWGRCWRTPSRRYYAPSYSYRGYYPSYGYRYGGYPYGYGGYGPGVGFSFRF